MGQARDEAGHIWETDAQGNPVRLLQAAQAQGPMTIGTPNPYQLPKAQGDAQSSVAGGAVDSATVPQRIQKATADASAATTDAGVSAQTAPYKVRKAAAEATTAEAGVGEASHKTGIAARQEALLPSVSEILENRKGKIDNIFAHYRANPHGL